MSETDAGGRDGVVDGEVSAFLGLPPQKTETIDPEIVRVIRTKIQEFSQLKSQNMRLTVTIDEVKSVSTKRNEALRAEVEKALRESDKIRNERDELDKSISELSNERTNLISNLETCKNEVKEQSEQRDLLKKDKQDIVNLLAEKVEELQGSKNECDRFLKQNKDLRNKIMELESLNQNLQFNDLNIKAEVQTLEQRLNLITKNNEWLEEQFNSQSEELVSLRQSFSSKLQASAKELSIVKNDLQLEQTTKQVIIEKNDELSKNLQEKMLQVKELSDTLATEKGEFQREMSLKQRLIDLLEKQSTSLKNELKFASERNDSYSSDAGENKSLHNEREKLISDLAELRSKYENSESERLRLEALVEEFMPNDEKLELNENSTMLTSYNTDSSTPSRKLYGDLSILRRQLLKEKHQKENLQRQVESFIIELEHKIPVINSFKKRTAMLEAELNDVALLLEHTSNEKETKEREFDMVNSKIKQYESNIHDLVRQRSDLAHQVQYLLLHISVQNDNNGPLTQDEVAFVKKILNNEDPNYASDSQRVISERLLEFDNVIAMQEKNAELLKTVRNLADKLEAEEFARRSDSMTIESKTIKEAKEAIVTLQSFNEKLESKLKSIEKERDAYKTLVADRKDREMASPSSLKKHDEIEKEESEKKIQTLEDQLTAVTTEYSKNIRMLNEEIQQLYKVKSEITINLEKEKFSRQLAEERLNLSQNSLELTQNENRELSRRSKHLQDLMEAQDQRTGKTMDEYIACKTKLGIVESKISNMEAERDLLKSSENRLKDGYKKLSDEKNTLRIMVTQLQTLQSEREIMLQSIQKDHQEKIKNLESAISKAHESLTSKDLEINTIKESSQNKSQICEEKIDSLRQEISELREKLTEKTVLVCKLESDVKNTKREHEESKARISSFDVLNDTENSEGTQKNIFKDLEKAKIALADAYSQVEHYKELASSSEESLNTVRAEYTEDRENLATTLENLRKEKDGMEERISSLNKQLQDVSTELKTEKEHSDTEKSELLKKFSILKANDQPLEEMKKKHELQIEELKKDLEEQASYANKAQKNYEEELKKHEAISKTVSELREQVRDYKLSAEHLKSSRDQLSATLEESEKSWLVQKSDLEAQLDANKERLEDLSTQNKLLYDQVELFSMKAGDQQGVTFTEEHDLLVSLRRERDILETKLAVSDREVKTLRQKQTILENELKMARAQAAELKETDAKRQSFTIEHQKIMEQLNQLNLMRESNTTLRNAAQAANKKNDDLREELDNLQKKLIPLQSENASLHDTIQEKDQQIILYKSESNRWRERSQEILQKQERIDPEEYEKLGNEVSSLKSQLEERIKENTDLNDRFNRLKKQAHEKLNASKNAQTTLTSELNELQEAKKNLEESLQKETIKCRDLESKLAQTMSSVEFEKLQDDLAKALLRSNEVEESLQDTVNSSNTLTEHLKNEIASLKNELSILKAKEETTRAAISGQNEDLSNVVESMKQAFEQEKIDFIKTKTEEFNKQLEMHKSHTPATQNVPQISNIDEEKRKWADEYESAVLQRIQEAEENLKRRIRKPTEDRINSVIEKKKQELEDEYKKKLFIQDNEIPLSDQQREEIRKELEKDLQNHFENDLKEAKKKSFEEGKQQASMKTTLLERKISKLETQLKDRENGAELKEAKKPSENDESSDLSTLSKIDESAEAGKKPSRPPTSGEQVLKLNNNPTFGFQTTPNSNPFTSSFQNTSFENNSVFGAKPSFGVAGNGESSPFGKFATGFGSNVQKPTFSLAPTPMVEKPEEAENATEKESSGESNNPSPSKRPTESEEQTENKRLKEDSTE